MKVSRALYQRLLSILHLIPPSSADGNGGVPTNPKSTILLQNDLVPQNKRLSTDSYSHTGNPPSSDKPNRLLTREELEERITQLWKEVWLGLYQVHDSNGPRHYDRIKALCHGAGLTHRSYNFTDLSELDCRFWRLGENKGVAGLKLYEHLSVLTLEAVVELLEAYQNEIVNLEKLYKVLREDQLGILSVRPSCYTHSRYTGVAESLAKRLSRLDSRMDVLIIDIYDEAMALHAYNPELQKGQYVYHRAFPDTVK